MPGDAGPRRDWGQLLRGHYIKALRLIPWPHSTRHGWTPALTGVYYDVAYSRNYNAPAKTTGNGNAAGPCTPYGRPTGTTTEYDEGIDINKTKPNGGAPGASLTACGIASIDPLKLVRDPENGCAPIYPWDFVRANSIFSVIHTAGGYTAWSDKHPSYSSVSSGVGPSALDDYYSPEINSNVVALPGVKTGLSCSPIPDKGADLSQWACISDSAAARFRPCSLFGITWKGGYSRLVSSAASCATGRITSFM